MVIVTPPPLLRMRANDLLAAVFPEAAGCQDNHGGVVREDMEQRMIARNAHELLRALETQSILDCADMAAHASLYRTESTASKSPMPR